MSILGEDTSRETPLLEERLAAVVDTAGQHHPVEKLDKFLPWRFGAHILRHSGLVPRLVQAVWYSTFPGGRKEENYPP